MTIITGKGSEDRACAAQKKEEKSAQTSRKGVTVEVCCIFISVYAFSILIYCVPRSIICIPFLDDMELVILEYRYIVPLQYILNTSSYFPTV